jgi:hypothetical protein
VDSLAVAIVGAGGVGLERRRVDRPRWHSTVEDVVADLAELARTVRGRRPPEMPARVGSPSPPSSAGPGHRSVRPEPRLGGRRSGSDSPRSWTWASRSTSPTTRTSAPSPSTDGVPRSAWTTSCTSRARSAWAAARSRAGDR